MHSPVPFNPAPRPSHCINLSRELERERIERMSVEERIRLAIGLKERLARLLPGLAEATLSTRATGGLRIIPLPHLIGLKLYAGGMKSKADIVELLRRNPSFDRDTIRSLCRRYRLRGLEPLIREADTDKRGP